MIQKSKERWRKMLLFAGITVVLIALCYMEERMRIN